MSNPHYESDLRILESNCQLSAIANQETILLVVGCHPIPELLDRPLAEVLRDGIDALGAPNPFRRGIVLGDMYYMSDASLWQYPALSVGGPMVNALTAQISQSAGMHHVFGSLYWVRSHGSPVKAAVWGQTSRDCYESVRDFIESSSGLIQFLNMVWS